MAVGPDAGLARAKAHSKAQLMKWGKEGERPVSLDTKAVARLESLLHRSKSQRNAPRSSGYPSTPSGEPWLGSILQALMDWCARCFVLEVMRVHITAARLTSPNSDEGQFRIDLKNLWASAAS
jgi:hypothetical protein